MTDESQSQDSNGSRGKKILSIHLQWKTLQKLLLFGKESLKLGLAPSAEMPAQYSMVVQKSKLNVKIYQ